MINLQFSRNLRIRRNNPSKKPFNQQKLGQDQNSFPDMILLRKSSFCIAYSIIQCKLRKTGRKGTAARIQEKNRKINEKAKLDEIAYKSGNMFSKHYMDSKTARDIKSRELKSRNERAPQTGFISNTQPKQLASFEYPIPLKSRGGNINLTHQPRQNVVNLNEQLHERMSFQIKGQKPLCAYRRKIYNLDDSIEIVHPIPSKQINMEYECQFQKNLKDLIRKHEDRKITLENIRSDSDQFRRVRSIFSNENIPYVEKPYRTRNSNVCKWEDFINYDASSLYGGSYSHKISVKDEISSFRNNVEQFSAEKELTFNKKPARPPKWEEKPHGNYERLQPKTPTTRNTGLSQYNPHEIMSDPEVCDLDGTFGKPKSIEKYSNLTAFEIYMQEENKPSQPLPSNRFNKDTSTASLVIDEINQKMKYRNCPIKKREEINIFDNKYYLENYSHNTKEGVNSNVHVSLSQLYRTASKSPPQFRERQTKESSLEILNNQNFRQSPTQLQQAPKDLAKKNYYYLKSNAQRQSPQISEYSSQNKSKFTRSTIQTSQSLSPQKLGKLRFTSKFKRSFKENQTN